MDKQNDKLKTTIKKIFSKDDRLWTDKEKTNLNETLLIDFLLSRSHRPRWACILNKQLK